MTVDGEMLSRVEVFDEADLDAALARFDELQPADTAAGKRGKPSGRPLLDATSRPATGTPWRRCWPTTIPVTIAVGWSAPESDMVEMPTSKTCGRAPNFGSRTGHRPSWRPAVSASPSYASVSQAAIKDPRHSSRSCSSSRDRRRRAAGGGGRVRARRLRRRHRGTRRPVPRRRSGRPRAHMVGDGNELVPRLIGTNFPRRHRIRCTSTIDRA